ncbi:cytochrome c oxidase subunit I [Aliidiomarina halalkaliphila]|uniref:cytochrome-c oxidase n=1 Tax=Aliidiomarina halalkaliphila TaxID=2593535 RepID=A0A552X1D7_9GAMM|nr:cytochrome c oxidase subunit I [Aliidiomarina halalkaliphila]TRW48413.1 cytochrome c oxidase subunit I [Aliidiomarina halalkaliphila]
MTNAEFQRRMAQVWDNLPGWGQLAAVNHTSIGRRFMVTGAIFFLIGGVMAMLMRTQLALPNQDIVPADVYSQLFTMHGTIMMFLFAIPILEGLAIYMIPKLIGARDLVFPRISSLGYYCYLFGGIIIMSSLFFGIAPDSGWFMYTPLSSAEFSPGPGSDFWLLGITFVEISAMAAGVELTVSILRSRAPGMTLSKMPIFCWYILAMALMIVFGFPPLILASILLELERAAGMPFFEVASGGDPILWQHLFWLFGHPEVYIIFLPAAAVISTIIPVFSKRPIIGYKWIVLSIILTAFISFGIWVHHMFTIGIPPLAQAFFSIASMLVAIPTAIQIFAWLATLWMGRPSFNLPMLWVFGFLIVFVCGGLTGVMLALVPFNWQVHDTHFVVAHLHYVLIGGMVYPLIAGIYYWLPHFSGRMPSLRLGRWGFWLTFIGMNATFFMMHLTGLLGMPRRVFTYEAGLGWDGLNLLSSVGGFIMTLGIGLVLLDIILHFKFGKKAEKNPWQADTLEWATGTPPVSYNFASIPNIESRHPLWDNPSLLESMSKNEHGLAEIRHGRRELLGTEVMSGKLTSIFHIPTHSWWPLFSALGLALVCVSLLVRVYPLAIVGCVLAAIFLLRWSWENGAHPSMAPPTKYDDPKIPLHSRTHDGPGLWGMVITLLADGALYLSLLFGWLYLWLVAPEWSMPSVSPLSIPLLFTAGLLLTILVVFYHMQIRYLKAGNDRGLERNLGLLGLMGVVHTAVLITLTTMAPLELQSSAHDAVIFVMLIYLIFHSGLGSVLTLMQALRVRLGYVGKTYPYEPIVLRPWWTYTLGIFWCSVATFVALPMLWGS